MTDSIQQTTRDSRRSSRAAILAGAIWGFFTFGLTSLLIATVLLLVGPQFDFVVFRMFLFPFVAVPAITIAGTVLGAYCGSVLSCRMTAGTSHRRTWETVLAGAVYGWVAFGLISLLIAAVLLVANRFHPIQFVVAFIGVPTISIAGSLVGALCGFVVCLLNKKRHAPAICPARSTTRWLPRSALVYGLCVILVVSGTIIWVMMKHRPIARLESLGGHISYRTGAVTFPEGNLRDADLPAVIDCLNEITEWHPMEWHHLILSGTNVSGDGLRHLQSLIRGFHLTLFHDQLDEAGINHLSTLQNLSNLCVTGGSVASETRLQVQQALPNVQNIEYQEELPY